MPDKLDGVDLAFDDRLVASGYPRFVLTCTRHSGCVKRRNIGPRTTGVFGAVEPLGYLGAWLALPADSAEEHRSQEPTISEVETWLIDHGYIES